MSFLKVDVLPEGCPLFTQLCELSSFHLHNIPPKLQVANRPILSINADAQMDHLSWKQAPSSKGVPRMLDPHEACREESAAVWPIDCVAAAFGRRSRALSLGNSRWSLRQRVFTD